MKLLNQILNKISSKQFNQVHTSLGTLSIIASSLGTDEDILNSFCVLAFDEVPNRNFSIKEYISRKAEAKQGLNLVEKHLIAKEVSKYLKDASAFYDVELAGKIDTQANFKQPETIKILKSACFGDVAYVDNKYHLVNPLTKKVTAEYIVDAADANFAKLHELIGEARKDGFVDSVVDLDGDLVVTTRPGVSYDLANKIEALGYEVEEVDQTDYEDVESVPTYNLRIKMSGKDNPAINNELPKEESVEATVEKEAAGMDEEPLKPAVEKKADEDDITSDDNGDEKAQAVSQHTGEAAELTEWTTYGLPTYKSGNEEYAVASDEKEVYNAVVEEVESILDDVGYDAFMWDNMGGIENFVNNDWFEDARKESNESYARDIAEYAPERFKEEAKEYGITVGEDIDEDAIYAFAEKMKENQEENPVEWFVNNFGKDEIKDLIKDLIKEKKIKFDTHAIADEVINLDGPGHVLSLYDGNEVEQQVNGKTYFLYRQANHNNLIQRKASKTLKSKYNDFSTVDATKKEEIKIYSGDHFIGTCKTIQAAFEKTAVTKTAEDAEDNVWVVEKTSAPTIDDQLTLDIFYVVNKNTHVVAHDAGFEPFLFPTQEDAQKHADKLNSQKEASAKPEVEKQAEDTESTNQIQEAINSKDSQKVLHLLEDNAISPTDPLYQQAIDILVQDSSCAYDAINLGVLPYTRQSDDYEKAVNSILNAGDVESAIWLIARNNYTGKSFEKVLELALQDKTKFESELNTYASDKFAEFVLSHIKNATQEENIEKKAEEDNEYHVEIYTKLDADENPEGFDAERYDHNYFKTLEEAKVWAEKLTNKDNHYYEISLNDEVIETSEDNINKKADQELKQFDMKQELDGQKEFEKQDDFSQVSVPEEKEDTSEVTETMEAKPGETKGESFSASEFGNNMAYIQQNNPDAFKSIMDNLKQLMVGDQQKIYNFLENWASHNFQDFTAMTREDPTYARHSQYQEQLKNNVLPKLKEMSEYKHAMEEKVSAEKGKVEASVREYDYSDPEDAAV